MNKRLFLIGSLLALMVLAAPVMAQDGDGVLIPVSGTYNYTPEILNQIVMDGYSYIDAVDVEAYFGDFEGTATSKYHVVIDPLGRWEGWIITEFEGTVLGREGTMQMVYTYILPGVPGEWYGEWWIVGGTGELTDLHGSGYAWGPGFNPENPAAEPDIYYSGEVMFLPPAAA